MRRRLRADSSLLIQAMNLVGIRWVIADICKGVEVPLEEDRGRVGPVPGLAMLSRMPEMMATPMVPLTVRIGREDDIPSQHTESIVFTCHCPISAAEFGIDIFQVPGCLGKKSTLKNPYIRTV